MTLSPGFALPADPQFWLSLFEEAKGWGLMTYEQVSFVLCPAVHVCAQLREQDWLWTQFLGMQVTTRTVHAAADFLGQMAAAAAVWNVSVQYCMALPRHALAASALPSVSHIRVRSSPPFPALPPSHLLSATITVPDHVTSSGA